VNILGVKKGDEAMKRTACILVIVVLAPLASLLGYSEAYECGDCHPITQPPTPITNCVESGCHDTYANGNHHTTANALAGKCTACHDPNLVADYDEDNPSPSEPTDLTPTVQSCNNCHKGQANPVDQNGDPYRFPIDNTAVLEHMGLQGYVSQCTLCHSSIPGDPAPIKQCETCHTAYTLHNIAGHAVTPPDPLPYDGYWYDANGDWNLIDNNARCIACHSIPPDPAPDTMLYVSQDVGTCDTIYEELGEADCRVCHPSMHERHHQLLNPPTIDKIRGVKEPGGIIRIIGGYFEDTQEDSIVHLGSRTYDSSKLRIKLWSPTKIKIKLPNYSCSWFNDNDLRKLKVWVTVNGKDSNVKKPGILRPASCP
jgi:hypothetical protein